MPPDESGGMESIMENYIFFIGGSGARVYKAFLHSAASGILQTNGVSVLMVDADKENIANVECLQLYRVYKEIYDILSKQKNNINIFSCDIRMESMEVLSPVKSNSDNLQNSIGSIDKNRIRILEALYTEKERMQELGGGFYAHPNIGCVFFSDFNNSEFNQCLRKIEQQLGNSKEVNITLVGSIFGGTGAAGIPTLYKLIYNKFKDNTNFNKLSIGGVFLTPYFTVSEKCTENNKNIPIHMEEFYFNTYEALSYYQTNTDMKFDSIYLVGQEKLDVVNNNYADSGVTQNNKAHITELYAVLAIDRFLCCPVKKGIFGYIRKEELDWNSFPISSDENILRLANFTRAQAFMVSEIYPYVYSIKSPLKEIFAKMGIMIPQWYAVYHVNKSSVRHEVDLMRQYSAEFVQWIYFVNSVYNGEANLVIDDSMKLFGDVLENIYIVSQGLNKKENESESELKSQIKIIRDKFNTIVNTTYNIEYVLKKVGLIASLAGVFTGTGVGAIGLLAKIVSLVGKQE